MNPKHLVGMANDIAANLQAEPDRDAAIDGMVLHLQRFWEPRMREQIVMHTRAMAESVDGDGDVDGYDTHLSPFAREAVDRLSRRLDQAPPPPYPEGGGDAG